MDLRIHRDRERGLKAVIVDDERLARQELRAMLEQHPEIEIVGEASDAGEAAALIREVRPDLVFLDIQMPGRNGFDLLEELGPGERRTVEAHGTRVKVTWIAAPEAADRGHGPLS